MKHVLLPLLVVLSVNQHRCNTEAAAFTGPYSPAEHFPPKSKRSDGITGFPLLAKKPIGSKPIFRAVEPPSKGYDFIVVGSGNGACGFLANCLEKVPADTRILVIEEGENFFETSGITHQNYWTKSYSEGSIFQLHNARTVEGLPIISGRACTMGGGGSINYTMIHESSKWLAKVLGHTEQYWDALKKSLNKRFQRADPASIETPVTKHILDAGVRAGFAEPDPNHRVENIPSYQDQDKNQLYQFPTQFNAFGQRTNSGVSLVDWEDERVELLTRTRVVGLTFDSSNCCTSIRTESLVDKSCTDFAVAPSTGKVLLCAGAASPRLLMPYRDKLQNQAIGKSVNDHICVVLGLYVLPKRANLEVSPKDIYGPVFGTTVVKAETNTDEDAVACIDFFTGALEKQLYMVSHLFLAFLPNPIKSMMLNQPWLFTFTKNFVRILVSIVGLFLSPETEFATAIIKFNGAHVGQYEDKGSNRITLQWFEGPRDAHVAKTAIANGALPFLDQIGDKPSLPLRLLYRLATKVAYKESQVPGYVEHYRKNSLLSEQHMAGGLLFGTALETGVDGDSKKTGLVKGSSNLHVADLSSTPLPRVSPQMTAYLVGYHVAEQLFLD